MVACQAPQCSPLVVLIFSLASPRLFFLCFSFSPFFISCVPFFYFSLLFTFCYLLLSLSFFSFFRLFHSFVVSLLSPIFFSLLYSFISFSQNPKKNPLLLSQHPLFINKRRGCPLPCPIVAQGERGYLTHNYMQAKVVGHSQGMALLVSSSWWHANKRMGCVRGERERAGK